MFDLILPGALSSPFIFLPTQQLKEVQHRVPNTPGYLGYLGFIPSSVLNPIREVLRGMMSWQSN